MDTAPPQDSPKHILNILNDDCIEAILRQMEWRDLFSVAATCKRFQKNARVIFRPMGMHWNICISRRSKFIHFDQVQRLFQMFGDLISTLFLDDTFYPDTKSQEEILKIIAHFCGRTLQRLELFKLTCDFNSLSPFTALQELKVSHSKLTGNCKVHLNIKTLRVHGAVLEYKKGRPLSTWVVQTFPYLEVAFFRYIDIKRDMLNQFLILNPQLKALDIESGRRITSSILQDIGHRVPNIEKFRISFCCNHRVNDFPTMNANMVHISGLSKLKILDVGVTPNYSTEILIDSLIESNILIEDIRLRRKSFPRVMAMQSIRNLLISDISNDEMIATIQNMNQLKDFRVHLCTGESLDLSLIRDVLRYGENLTFFAVWVECRKLFEVDAENYNSLLVLAKGRVKVEIYVDNFTLPVAKNVLDANRAWIDFSTYAVGKYSTIFNYY